jgi:hypothetical protein
MRNLTALTLALTLALNLSQAHANDGKASKTDKTEGTLLRMECRNGKWEITYAKNEEIVKKTQADKLQGQPCYNQGKGGKKP